MSTSRPGRPALADRATALQAAVDRFERGERLELRSLADALGVGRTTLHGWFGTREQLLARVLIARAAPRFLRARREATGAGADLIADVLARYNAELAVDAPLLRLLSEEAAVARRVLTARDGAVHRSMRSALSTLIEEEMAGGYRPALPVAPLTLALTRLGEAFLFIDLVDGDPDVEALRVVQAALLGASGV